MGGGGENELVEVRSPCLSIFYDAETLFTTPVYVNSTSYS